MPYRLRVLAQQAGIRGLFAGLGPRMVMTAGLVSGQFLMYGAIKDGECARSNVCTKWNLMNVLQRWARRRDWRSTRRNADLQVERKIEI